MTSTTLAAPLQSSTLLVPQSRRSSFLAALVAIQMVQRCTREEAGAMLSMLGGILQRTTANLAYTTFVVGDEARSPIYRLVTELWPCHGEIDDTRASTLRDALTFLSTELLVPIESVTHDHHANTGRCLYQTVPALS